MGLLQTGSTLRAGTVVPTLRKQGPDSETDFDVPSYFVPCGPLVSSLQPRVVSIFSHLMIHTSVAYARVF